MELGYFTMPLHPPGQDYTKTLNDDLEQLVALDALGYKEAWLGEHFTAAWENIPSPDLLIASAIPQTKNIIFGTGVTCMPNHNPFTLAHRIAQLDHMARGRFHWGIGSGGWPGDFEVFGVDPASGDQRTLTKDAVELILKIWNDPTPGTYESKHWKFTIPEPGKHGVGVHVKPYQKPHPPIAVAGVSAKSDTLVQAGERDWMPMSVNLLPTRILESHWDAVTEGARRHKRTPDRSKWRIARNIYIADTTKQARKEALEGVISRDFQEYFLPLLGDMKMSDIFKKDLEMHDSDVTPEYMMDNVWIVGSPDDVAEKLRQLYNEVGGFGVVLAMGNEWEPREQWINSMTLLSEEVMPKLSDLT